MFTCKYVNKLRSLFYQPEENSRVFLLTVKYTIYRTVLFDLFLRTFFLITSPAPAASLTAQ